MTWIFAASGTKQYVRLEATRFAKKHADDKYAPFKAIGDKLERRKAEQAVAPEVACATRAMHYITTEIDWCHQDLIQVVASGDGTSITELSIK